MRRGLMPYLYRGGLVCRSGISVSTGGGGIGVRLSRYHVFCPLYPRFGPPAKRMKAVCDLVKPSQSGAVHVLCVHFRGKVKGAGFLIWNFWRPGGGGGWLWGVWC